MGISCLETWFAQEKISICLFQFLQWFKKSVTELGNCFTFNSREFMSNLTDLTTPQVQKIAGPLGGLLIKVDIQQVVIAIDRLSVCFGWVVWGSNVPPHSPKTHWEPFPGLGSYLFVNVLITNLSLHGEKEDNSKKCFYWLIIVQAKIAELTQLWILHCFWHIHVDMGYQLWFSLSYLTPPTHD